ncbi:MAG: pyruvate kinase, partial [Pseudomonadota bacterium]
MPRRTKIIATLGPATDDAKTMQGLIQCGLDLARINLSHDTHSRHRDRVRALRACVDGSSRHVGLLADLQGPKIRIGRFREGSVVLKEGELFAIDLTCPLDEGDLHRVGTTYGDLVRDVVRGNTLLLDDGAIALWVNEVQDSVVHCRVVVGGELSNHKGINKLGGGLSAPALTDKDKIDIRFAAELGADYVAVSFVRNADDVRKARTLLREAGCQAGIIAKIERAEALNCIEEIIDASDAIMIARGDLGVELGDAELPSVQKRLIRLAQERNSVAIT